MKYANYNGNILEEKDICISPENRSFKYGDGFFETIRVINRKISLQHLHLERLYNSLDILKFTGFPNAGSIVDQIIKLVEVNNHHANARVRLTTFAGNNLINEISDRTANYLIQTYSLSGSPYTLNDDGLEVDFFKDGIKQCDVYSRLKTNNFLSYLMGILWAQENKLHDAILLNSSGNVADSTIANVFIIKDGIIKTPPLTDGPVDGVMRRNLIHCFKEQSMPFIETSISIEDVLEASEIFLTNAITGIRWVKKIGLSMYRSDFTTQLHEKFLANLST